MICPHCEEPILFLDYSIAVNDGRVRFHRECFVRVVAGSSAHQLQDCCCYGGDREDPAGLTLRQAALLAFETFEILRGAPARDLTAQQGAAGTPGVAASGDGRSAGVDRSTGKGNCGDAGGAVLNDRARIFAKGYGE